MWALFPVKCAAGVGIEYFFKPLFLFLKICPQTKRTEQTKKNKQNQRDATSRVNEQEKEKTQVGG
jgi:hypothetical protein